MKKKLIDVLYYVTIFLFFVVVLLSIIFVIKDNLSITAIIGGFQFFLIFIGILISPIIILIAIINRLFFDKIENKTFFKVLVLNLIYIAIAFYSVSNIAEGFSMI